MRVVFMGLSKERDRLIVGGGCDIVLIDGKEAIDEGPRRVGHCIYCNGQCNGKSGQCAERVWLEAEKLARLGGGK